MSGFEVYQRPGSKVRCGTQSGWSWHRNHGEKPCDACALTKREYDIRRLSADGNTIKNRLTAKAQGLALRRLKDAHRDEYRSLYLAAKSEVFLGDSK